ncbi:MAG: hypothetical protein C4318_06000 [Acidimicrobiia bacterium]
MGLNPTPITDSTPKILSRTVEGQPAGEAGLLVLDLLFLFACMWRVAPTFCIPRNGSPQVSGVRRPIQEASPDECIRRAGFTPRGSLVFQAVLGSLFADGGIEDGRNIKEWLPNLKAARRADYLSNLSTHPILDSETFFSKVAQATLDVSEDLDSDRELEELSEARSANFRTASVLVPLFGGDKGPGVLLVKRSDKVSLHKGEICFPGGSLEESDSGALEAALRETQEEIGLSRENIEILGRLPAGLTAVTSYLVIPFVGVIPFEPDKVTPQPSEVADVMWVSISELVRDGSYRTEPRRLHGIEKAMHFFDLANGETVWGLTARILHELLVRAGVFSLNSRR